ncbi:tRNA:m(4)X modification enzyme TRM13 like [Dissostichus eleginoides]|uniref:tRNA:m(4)X modification enzyme TRM13 n=1 Tax=Dissostichus eleginoides TaxID=100907 RepID=A0AAD9C6M8_DISEL|nr:tRNA:m(4)X modification enzyme TRM13 like [Dissostichus eleginoides]
MAAPLPGRCGFFVEKKKRFCKMIVARGNVFCGEHATQVSAGTRGGFRDQWWVQGPMGEGSCRRIVCPLDPKHTVSEDKLEKHLKKCNSREKPKPVYYVENINAGPADGDETLQQVSLCDLSRTQLQSLLDKLKTAAKGHMEALGLLGRGRSFVEFGAGRGKLSHWIHEALRRRDPLKTGEEQKTSEDLKDLQFLLVERSSTRFKVDGKHQEAGVQFERMQVDIQHLDLSKVAPLTDRKLPLVAVGKHLCGAATDLALRCLLDTPEFFLQRGIGAEEFSAFCRMSSWATCGMRPTNQDAPSQDPANQSKEEEEHEPAEERDTVSGFLSVEEREQVGRLCKQLIDAGRIHFLQERGFNSKLTRYVSSQVTLENVLLTAVP